jgi:AraC family transcriptional regulator
MRKKQTNKEFYTEKLNIIVEYIHNNLDKKIDINELARLSNFSPFHFHRIVKALLSESIGSYIIRTRLEQAAKMISYSSSSIEEIAYSVGYEAPSSLSKQFKNHFGISPSEYRKTRVLPIKSQKIMDLNLKIKKPKIVVLEEKQCLFIRMQGNYQQLDYSSAWAKLWSIVKTQKLFTAGIEHIGISYDDPKVTDDNKIRYDACLVIYKDAKPDGEVGVKTLKGGKFAMFHYTGSYKYLSAVYDYIFNEWLLNNEYELRDEPVREKYRNNPDKTEESKLKTEIYLPIR